MKKVALLVLAAVLAAAVMAAIVPSPVAMAAGIEDIRVWEGDSQMTSRLDRVGARVMLGVQEMYPKYKDRLRFRIYDEPELNACALADGRIFVSRGMMVALSARPDDELAAVLAHEATHVVQKHHRGQTEKAVWWGLGTLAAGALGKTIGVDTDTAQKVVAGIGAIDQAGFSRKDENRADDGSVDLCAAVGFDPLAPARVLQLLQDKYGRGMANTPVLGWFASHPDTKDRVKRTSERAEKSFGSRSVTQPLPVTESLVAGNPGSQSRETAIGRVARQPSANLGGIAVIVRDNSSRHCYGDFWEGWSSSEEAVRVTMEAALEQTGRFIIVDQAGREDAWDEQDLAESGRMDPATMPSKGRTHGARHFLYITLNFYKVTEEIGGRVGGWQQSADLTRLKAEIKGQLRLEPVERSTVFWSAELRGEEHGYKAEGRVGRSWGRSGLEGRWASQPAGQAVAKACQKAAEDLVGALEGLEYEARADQPEPAYELAPSPPAPATPRPAKVDLEKVEEFELLINPLPSEKDVEPLMVKISVSTAALYSADYILFLDKSGGNETVVAKVWIDYIRGREVWGSIEYPYLKLLDVSRLKKVRLMRSD